MSILPQQNHKRSGSSIPSSNYTIVELRLKHFGFLFDKASIKLRCCLRSFSLQFDSVFAFVCALLLRYGFFVFENKILPFTVQNHILFKTLSSALLLTHPPLLDLFSAKHFFQKSMLKMLRMKDVFLKPS